MAKKLLLTAGLLLAACSTCAVEVYRHEGGDGRSVEFSASVGQKYRRPFEKLVADVQQARLSADVVLVSLHWGVHFVARPCQYQPVVARAEINRYEGEKTPPKPQTYRGMFDGPS